MKRKLFLLASLAIASSSAFAQFANIQTSCSNNQFQLTADLDTSASCSYNEKLTVNGIESFETIEFQGAFTRSIPLQVGDQASVRATFQCTLPNGSFSGTRSNRTEDGCNTQVEIEPQPLPEPEPAPQPPIEEFDPAALQEFQLELGEILTLAQADVDRIEVRAARFAGRNQRFVDFIISTGLRRINAVTEARVDRAVALFIDRVEPEELLTALEQFEDEFALITNIQL